MATSEGIPSSIDIEFLELNDNPYLSHELIRQTWLILGLEAQSYVPHRLLNPWI